MSGPGNRSGSLPNRASPSRDDSERPLWKRRDTAAASKRLYPAIREAGIKDERVTFHSFRHLPRRCMQGGRCSSRDRGRDPRS